MGHIQSHMTHQFSQVPKAEIPRSTFTRSHGYKTTFDAGYLVPFYVDEVLPGDTFKLKTNIFARLATPIVPLMDNLRMETFFFAVPLRLVWEHWQQFCGEQPKPGDSTDYLIPQVSTTSGFAVGSVADYFGLPTGIPNLKASALPFRAYNLIWNEWFRDQNMQDSVTVPRDDGEDGIGLYSLLRRGKRHDYFTSALPWPQKGPGVELPLGTSAPVIGNGMGIGFSDGTNNLGMHSYSAAGFVGDPAAYGDAVGTANTGIIATLNKTVGVTTDPTKSGLIADLSGATAATINSLREAFQLQRMFERDARGGTRYTEILRAHFGVVSPDARLQRPEYLGGSSAPVIISPIAQTSSSDATTPQGNLAAFGVVGDSSHGFVKSFTEHCIIIGLVNVRADLTYQQGLNRMWSRRTRFDFYWPALAHLGEQAILNKEIYAQGSGVVVAGKVVDDQVFGYQERFAEYRYYPSMITGKFRSSDPQSLDVWHLAQDFESLPALSSEFIEDKPPVARVIAVPSEPHFLLDSFFEIQATRPMPLYGVPGYMDHF